VSGGHERTTINCDREPEELGILTLDWDGIPAQSFNTAAEDGAKFRSFIFGSCRYLLRLLSGSWFNNRGAKTFRANQFRRVVFLFGDAHTSLSAELVSPESNPTSKIIGLTSFAFYWPYPHSPKRAFRLEGVSLRPHQG